MRVPLSKTKSIRLDESSKPEEEEQRSPVKSVNVAALLEDPKLKHKLKELLMDSIKEEVSHVRETLLKTIDSKLTPHAQQILETKQILQGQVDLLGSRLGKVPDCLGTNIMLKFFPQATITELKLEDTEGEVYGWPDEIVLFLIQDKQTKLVYGISHLNKANLAVYLRAVRLYHSFNPEDAAVVQQYIILSATVSSDAQTIASDNNIQIMLMAKQ